MSNKDLACAIFNFCLFVTGLVTFAGRDQKNIAVFTLFYFTVAAINIWNGKNE